MIDALKLMGDALALFAVGVAVYMACIFMVAA